MLVLLEGLVMCFLLLIVCVIGIANGPVGLVVFYEKDVQERVIELGLTTRKKINTSFFITSLALFVPELVFVPLMVYCFNGVTGFWDGFLQMTAIILIQGLFDRLFIDWYWVGHTKAWQIPGTEDLKPYIPAKVMFGKWFSTLVFFPLFMALIAGVIEWLR